MQPAIFRNSKIESELINLKTALSLLACLRQDLYRSMSAKKREDILLYVWHYRSGLTLLADLDI